MCVYLQIMNVCIPSHLECVCTFKDLICIHGDMIFTVFAVLCKNKTISPLKCFNLIETQKINSLKYMPFKVGWCFWHRRPCDKIDLKYPLFHFSYYIYPNLQTLIYPSDDCRISPITKLYSHRKC